MYVHQCQNCQQLFFTDSNSKTALSHSTLSSLLCTMYLLCAGVLVVVARYVDGRMLLFKFQYPIIQHNAQHFNLHISVTFALGLSIDREDFGMNLPVNRNKLRKNFYIQQGDHHDAILSTRFQVKIATFLTQLNSFNIKYKSNKS